MDKIAPLGHRKIICGTFYPTPYEETVFGLLEAKVNELVEKVNQLEHELRGVQRIGDQR